MHTTSRAIRIIKREHRKAVEEEGETEAPASKTDSELRREILTTISSWVEHQREAKKELHRQSSVFKKGI